MTEDYLNQQWERLGWHFGHTLNENSHQEPPHRHNNNEPGDDPKREYFEKIGAQFAVGFLAGTNVGEFDEVDLFECLHAEPKAVEAIYRADETLKSSWIKKDPQEAVHGLDELIGFVVELVMETYPHTHIEVCKDFDKTKKAQWEDLARIMHDERDKETTLQADGDKLYFNKKDISKEAGEMVEDYLKSEFRHLGWTLGKTMNDAA